jgi:hypothetical protein
MNSKINLEKVPKKALIISYYWPPAGGPGVQRWLKFVKYLPDFDVEPIVYIPSNPNYPIIDESLMEDIPDGVKIIKQAIREPYKFAGFLSKKKSKTISKGIIPKDKSQTIVDKLLLFIRGNLFIPDARKQWISPSVQYLSTYISDYDIDTVITTGPPHSMHLIGLKLQEIENIKWIADFRDPWTTIGYHKQLKLTKKAKSKHIKLENDVLNRADQIVVTSHVTKREFEEKTKKPVAVITNGYDTMPSEKLELDTKFSLAHIGSLLSRRNPEALWFVLKELIEENPSFACDFELNLVGFVSEDVLNSIDSYGISSYVNKVGYVSHNESITHQKKSQLLLLIEIDDPDTRCIIPGKLFEYLVSERPIIALGPKGSDVERILTETNTGNYFYYDAYKSLKNIILEHYISFKDGKLQSHGIGLQKYSRKILTKSLAELI